MNKDIYTAECTASKYLKHERVEQAIERLGEVLRRLEGLSARISGEPCPPVAVLPAADGDLESLLRTAPDQIHGFCDAAVSMIDSVEERLF